MKYLKQLAIILTVSLIAEIMAYVLPLPIAASVYGLVLMILGLSTHIIPLYAVEETGDFLVENMGLMFVPPTVAIIACVEELKALLIPLLCAGVLTTVLIMVVSGGVTQFIIRRVKGEKNE